MPPLSGRYYKVVTREKLTNCFCVSVPLNNTQHLFEIGIHCNATTKAWNLLWTQMFCFADMSRVEAGGAITNFPMPEESFFTNSNASGFSTAGAAENSDGSLDDSSTVSNASVSANVSVSILLGQCWEKASAQVVAFIRKTEKMMCIKKIEKTRESPLFLLFDLINTFCNKRVREYSVLYQESRDFCALHKNSILRLSEESFSWRINYIAKSSLLLELPWSKKHERPTAFNAHSMKRKYSFWKTTLLLQAHLVRPIYLKFVDCWRKQLQYIKPEVE